MPAPFTLLVLLGVVLVKETLFRFVSRVGNELQSSAVRADAWHHRSDAITSAAAALGISIALVGGAGYEQADDWAAIFAAGVIAWNAYRLLRPTVSELMEEAPGDELTDQARTVALAVPGVRGGEMFRAQVGVHLCRGYARGSGRHHDGRCRPSGGAHRQGCRAHHAAADPRGHDSY
jgi:cation diffusion facilitator family transporter